MGKAQGKAERPERGSGPRIPEGLEKVLLPDRLRLDGNLRHAALTTVLFGLSMVLWCLVFIPVHIGLGSPRCASIIAGAGIAFILNALALRAHGSLRLTSNVTAAIVLLTLLVLSVFSGGYLSSAMLWLPAVPMIGILLANWRAGVVWLLVTLVSASAMYMLDKAGSLPPSDFDDENGQLIFILGLLGIVSCITLLAYLFETIADALRRRLEAAREAAIEANRAKSAFLARMSHEIRTPMNGVLGMLELLGNTEISGRQREYTRFAKQSADSLLRILNDILDFSKIEVGRLTLEAIPFDPREVVGDTLQSLAADAEAKGLELACQVEPEVPGELMGDPGRIRQILVNLVGNAIKFTQQGEVVVAVAPASQHCEGVCLDFSVRDTGIGIPADKHEQIWDVFGQADTSTTRRFGGTGLGLNISRQLVRMMGGELEFESEEGKGTTFFFTLRFQSAADSPRRQRPPVGSLEGTRVLVVDDNETNRRILEEVLRRWKMDVVSAEGAGPALETLKGVGGGDDDVKVALLDVMMPETDGITLAEQIRRDPGIQDVPLILLSSAYAAESKARCDELGIVAQLRKPVKQSELLNALLFALHLRPGAEAEEVSEEPTPPMKPVDILLAEDGAVNREVALGLLEAKGHRVTAVPDGRQAVAAWRDGRFDLILMDVEMPDLDGLEATRQIRREEEERGGHVPIVALTAHAIHEYEARCLAAGMDAHLPKPLEPKRLYETIREWTAS